VKAAEGGVQRPDQVEALLEQIRQAPVVLALIRPGGEQVVFDVARDFAAAAARMPQVVWVEWPADADAELAEVLELRSLPQVLAWHQGQLVFRAVGGLPEAGLIELAVRLQALPPSA